MLKFIFLQVKSVLPKEKYEKFGAAMKLYKQVFTSQTCKDSMPFLNIKNVSPTVSGIHREEKLSITWSKGE